MSKIILRLLPKLDTSVRIRLVSRQAAQGRFPRGPSINLQRVRFRVTLSRESFVSFHSLADKNPTNVKKVCAVCGMRYSYRMTKQEHIDLYNYEQRLLICSRLEREGRTDEGLYLIERARAIGYQRVRLGSGRLGREQFRKDVERVKNYYAQ